MSGPRCAPNRPAVAARCDDPLGSYPVALCPDCGHSVPLQPHHRTGDLVEIPPHRPIPRPSRSEYQ